MTKKSEPVFIVSHRRSLKQMEADGLIREPPEHVRPKNGRWGRGGGKGVAYHYVDEGTLGGSWTKWRGYEVRIVYRDGCFCPFVEARHLHPPVGVTEKSC